jgi:methyl-accepting chemotaxis protein
MWLWITLGLVVVLVVIAFLFGIVRYLGSIDNGLIEAASSVQNIGTDTDPLPGAVQSINTSLVGTDTSLKQVPDQAQQISAGLDKIADSLKLVDGSLKDTAGSLKDTNGTLGNISSVLVTVAGTTGDIDKSLDDTTDILVHVRDNAGKIEDTLEHAQHKDSEGTAAIAPRVDHANDVLSAVQHDTHTVVGQLIGVNKNLLAVCQSTLLAALPPFTCGV